MPTVKMNFLVCKAVSEANANLNITKCAIKCKFLIFQEKHNGLE